MDDLDAAYDAAEVAAPDEVPDGVYDAMITRATVGKTKNGGHPMLTLKLLIEAGEFVNRALRKWVVFSPSAMSYAKRDMETLGVGMVRPSELDSIVNGLRHRRFSVRQKTWNGKTNVYLRHALDGAELAAKKEEEKKDLPF